MLKRRTILSIIILILGSIYYFAYFLPSSKEFEIVNFPWSKVSALEISDKGILGNEVVIINHPDTILTFVNVMKKSTKVNFHDINFKSGRGLCTIEILYKDGEKNSMNLSNTSSGGILLSGSYYYRNDDLLKKIIVQLKNQSALSAK